MTQCDMTLERATCQQYVKDHGWDMFLGALDLRAARHLNRELGLYQVSTEWAWVPAIKVLKARGEQGDLLVALV